MEDVLYHTFYEIEKVHWWCVARRDILQAVVRDLLPTGGKVLDVGCGTGFFIESLMQEPGPRFEGWGLDASPLAVSMCRERGLTHVHEGSATDLSAVAAERFDAIFMFDVLEHLDDDREALAEAAKLLAPGGRIVVTVPAFRFLWSKHDDVSMHKRRYTRAELARAFDDAGLPLAKLTYFNAFLFPLALARRVGRRLTRTDDGVEFDVPAKPVNDLFRRVFQAEQKAVVASGPDGAYPVGLSILAATRPIAARG
jgi:SAM-dependent methyltransferase